MKKLNLLVVMLVIVPALFAFPPIRTELFVEAYVNRLPNLYKFIHPEEQAKCGRLGIAYENVDLKCMISYLLPEGLDITGYQTEIKDFDEYSAVELFFPDANYRKILHFKNGYYISPVSFHTRKWQIIDSEYFRFYLSDQSLINDYAIRSLESFVESTADLLEYSPADREVLQREKIEYVLCRDAEEIERVTGFKTLGIYLTAQDCLVSVFNAHYHELAHLLLNFKLKYLPLHTHPFWQEGIAVAVGGRGGLEADVLMKIGGFLLDSHLLDYTDLLTPEGFHEVDASLSYPVSGLYHRFLLQQMKMDNYLALYRRFSNKDARFIEVTENDLPKEKAWKSFLKKFDANKIRLQEKGKFKTVLENPDFVILENSGSYCFKTKGSLLLRSEETYPFYKSSLIRDKFPELQYAGEKYLILVNSEEVVIYNLFTDNLIADYRSGFTLDFQPLPQIDGFFQFYADKVVFDEPLQNYQITSIKP